MQIRDSLLQIAILISAASNACGSVAPEDKDRDSGKPDAKADATQGDAGSDSGPVMTCTGCGCPLAKPSATVTPPQACQIAYYVGAGPDCDTACAQGDGGNESILRCQLDQDYVNAYAATQGDASRYVAGLCPAWSSSVVVQCSYECAVGGRRTEGFEDVPQRAGVDPGTFLAERAYLEAVSVHAFATLEHELAAHGSPVGLRQRARKARRDEIRHTAMMTRLARRYGRPAVVPTAGSRALPRSLFDVARENAVEGCIRETYGAVVGLIEARTSTDPVVRRAMQSIAEDECRHAQLSWDVGSWILPRLTAAERAAIALATKEAVEALARDGDPRIVRLLSRRVWQPVAPTS